MSAWSTHPSSMEKGNKRRNFAAICLVEEAIKERELLMRETFSTAMKEAMKAGDKQRLSTIRMITAGLKDRDIAARGEGKGPISDDEILSMLQKMVKQCQEALDTAQKAGRAEMVAQAREEIAVLQSFLPSQMDETAARAAIREAISQTNAVGIKDMGKVIGVLKTKYSGQMDFGRASGWVKDALTG